MKRHRFDPFKDQSIAPPTESELGRPDILAGLDSHHPSRREDEEGVVPLILNRRPGERLNWENIARALAGGHSVESTASLYSCDAKRIWRNLRRSRRFRARIALEVERLRLQADLRFRDLHIHAALQMRHRAGKLDPRTLQWLAERLRMGETPAETRDLGDWLEAVARLPGKKRAGTRQKPAVADGMQSA